MERDLGSGHPRARLVREVDVVQVEQIESGWRRVAAVVKWREVDWDLGN